MMMDPPEENESRLTNKPAMGGVYVVLDISKHKDPGYEFVWSLYVHTTKKAGWRYQIKNFSQGWMPNHTFTDEILASITLVGLLRVAKTKVNNASLGKIDEWVTSHDETINNPVVESSQAWVMSILHELRSRNALSCDSMGDLENEIIAFAERHAPRAVNRVLPRPVEDSQLCW